MIASLDSWADADRENRRWSIERNPCLPADLQYRVMVRDKAAMRGTSEYDCQLSAAIVRVLAFLGWRV